MERKTFNLIEAKADEEGRFTALASVFGNVDSMGDRMMPGSFKNTLTRWRESGDPIPVILSHNWDDPFAMIGKADPRAVYEDERGLVVQGTLDLENEVARQVHKLMRDRLLKGWSFGYTIPKGGQKQRNGANEVGEVELVEVGPTLKGANAEAQLETIKSAIHSSGGILVPETNEVLSALGAQELKDGEPPESPGEPPTPKPAPPQTEPPEEPTPEEAKADLPPFPPSELFGASQGLLKAAWTTAYVDSLPDHSFLHVEEGGVPDWEGKTAPRIKRHFPYRDADGKLDRAHLHVALALADKTDHFSKSVREDLAKRAQRLLDEVEATPAIEGAAPVKVRARDQLRRSSLDVALEIRSDGRSKTQPPTPPPAPQEDPPPSGGELKRTSRERIMSVLTD